MSLLLYEAVVWRHGAGKYGLEYGVTQHLFVWWSVQVWGKGAHTLPSDSAQWHFSFKTTLRNEYVKCMVWMVGAETPMMSEYFTFYTSLSLLSQTHALPCPSTSGATCLRMQDLQLNGSPLEVQV